MLNPNYQTIAPLVEAYNIEHEFNIGNPQILTFQIPYMVDIRNKYIENPTVSKIKERFIVKFKRREIIEYFIIKTVTIEHDDSGDYLTIECVGTPVQLADKRIDNYKTESKNATSILRDVLSISSWGVGSIDGSFDILYRSFEFTGTLLEAVQNIAETFGALIVYNTRNKTVNFVKPENSGINRGLEVTREKLLKSIKYESDASKFCTRLKVTGKDGLTINEVTSTGSSYLENYGYFIAPFERDEYGNVISHSAYMSDNLAAALLDYADLKQSKEGEFSSLLSSLNAKHDALLIKVSELQDLRSQLNIIIDNSDGKQQKGQDNSAEIAQMTEKQIEINNKQSQINTLLNEKSIIENQINDLAELLSVENNFTNEQLLEWDNYIIDGEFTNEYVSDPLELKKLAEEYFKTVLEPQIVVELDIIDLLEVFEFQNSSDIDKLVVGDIINIKYDISGIDVKAKITGIKTNFESRTMSITISNVIKKVDPDDKLVLDIAYASTTANTFVQQKWAYDKAVNQADEVSQVLSETWSALDREIKAANNETVEIGRRGIIITDSEDRNRLLIMQNSVIGMSKDGGNHFSTAISPDGIIAEHLLGQIIASNNLIVTNSAGSVRIDSNGFNVTNMNLTLTRSDNKSRILMSPTDGIRVQKSIDLGTTWDDKFYIDTNGELVTKGIIHAAGGTFSGDITALGTITGGTINGANFSSGAITGGTITGSTIMTSSSTNQIILNSNGLSSIYNGVKRISIEQAGSSAFQQMRFYDAFGRLAGGISGSNGSDSNPWGLPQINFGIAEIGSSNVLAIAATRIVFDPTHTTMIDFQGTPVSNLYIPRENVTGLESYLNSRFASINTALGDLWAALAGKASIYHTHSVTIPNHNHGNSANLNSGGGTFTVS
ncbi:phage tail spike protein [Paenibacillus xylaniclasticus]|uniref:phage tail spike protein n=1 Tax=Paenibacillus xylaniclasticus TaxID=588083 RepID=UPI000FD94442|nr:MULTISPECIES: phage tail spike protein [Paenibacillus]GFN32610.1 hypothetical protein PCURB6_28700 [Paenibacillus curdlanolyticus]